jgi:signal transduction histidine kinase
METLALAFFPFPHVLAGERRKGYRFSWPERCNHCDRQCERLQTSTIATCSYGVNYTWFGPDLLVFGFLVKGPAPSSAQKKMLRSSPAHLISVEEIKSTVQVYAATTSAFDSDVEMRKAAIITEYAKNRRYEADFLENLRPEIQQSFSFVHDYKQFIARVRQNINVVIEARNTGIDFDEKLARALPAERAIYWASILMEEKLKTAFLLLHPEQITHTDEAKLFRLHGAVLKYVRIYNAAFAEKGVGVEVVGGSVGEIMGNPSAVPVIPHTLIDNALKYSKRGSEVLIEFQETNSEIDLRVISYGPQIEEDELDKIFDVFYRGRSARVQEEEGAGFGLYLAQFIATTMGTRINVWQGATPNKFGYRTTFSIRFHRAR